MEYVDSFDGFTAVAGTDGAYLQNGKIVVRSDNGCIISPHTRKSGKNKGYSYYRLRLRDGRRTEWSPGRVFSGVRGYNGGNSGAYEMAYELANWETDCVSSVAKTFGLDQSSFNRWMHKNHPEMCRSRADECKKRHDESVARYGSERARKAHRNAMRERSRSGKVTIAWPLVAKHYGTMRCAICGGLVEPSDYSIDNNGAFVAGPKYPSTDHIIEWCVSHDGSMENSQLVHFECNWRKEAARESKAGAA